MIQLIITDKARDILAQATGPVDLVDEYGQKIGRFIPEPFCPWNPTLTPEEAERIANEPGGHTLEEILTELRTRYPATDTNR
jgi:hypothetical protein